MHPYSSDTESYYDEKLAMAEQSQQPKNPRLSEAPPECPRILCNTKLLLLAYLAKACGLVCAFFLIRIFFSSVPSTGLTLFDGSTDSRFGSLQTAPQTNQSAEVISLAYPFIPKASYGDPVHTAMLIDHVFDLPGGPVVESFIPPKDIDYNKVVLTLNVSVDGPQLDRWGHLVVGGAEVWRFSTMKPDQSVHSSFKKDLTEYVSLFQQDTEVVFDFLNLRTRALNGSFHVQLLANFYQSEYFHSTDIESQVLQGLVTGHEAASRKNEIYEYFDVRGAASKVLPLKVNNRLVLSSSELVVTLPKVARNTTRLKLNILATGDGSEEQWYRKVLDKFADCFKDPRKRNGHGPLRFVTVWLDGKKVASQAPQPLILPRGFSSSLWAAVVPINAFDFPSIDLDISPFLPYLWDSEEHELKILIENGLDELQHETSGIGQGWVLSANMLTFEKPGVKLASGSVLGWTDSKSGLSFGVSLPYTKTLTQTAKGLFDTFVEGQFLVELRNGEVLNATMTSSFSGHITNVQNYKDLFHLASVVHTGNSEKSFSLVIDEEVIRLSDIRYHYFLTFEQATKAVDKGEDSSVSLVSVKVLDLDVDKKPAMKETQKQKGKSSTRVEGFKADHSNSLLSKFKSAVHGPDYAFVYKRHVKVAGSEITKDENSFKRE